MIITITSRLIFHGLVACGFGGGGFDGGGGMVAGVDILGFRFHTHDNTEIGAVVMNFNM
jgi:hypothetical protein